MSQPASRASRINAARRSLTQITASGWPQRRISTCSCLAVNGVSPVGRFTRSLDRPLPLPGGRRPSQCGHTRQFVEDDPSPADLHKAIDQPGSLLTIGRRRFRPRLRMAARARRKRKEKLPCSAPRAAQYGAVSACQHNEQEYFVVLDELFGIQQLIGCSRRPWPDYNLRPLIRLVR